MAEVLPPPTASAAVPLRRVRRLRPLRRPARPGEARRPAARGARRRLVAALRDRRRGPGSRAARGARRRTIGSTVASRSRAGSRRTTLADLYARCLAVFYAPVDEDFGLRSVRGVPGREAGRDDHATRAARSRSCGTAARASSASRRPRAIAEACAWLRANPRRGSRVGAGRDAARELISWDAAIDRLLAHEESPTTRRCRRSARGSPTTARCCCRRSSGGSTSRSRGGAGAAPRGSRRRALPRRQRLRSATVDRRSAAQASGRRRAARLRPAPPGRRNDARSRSAGGYLDAMQREDGVVGRMLAHGVIDGLLPPLWESRAHEFPLTGEVVDLRDRRDRPLTLRRAAGAGAGLRRAVWRIPHARLAGTGGTPVAAPTAGSSSAASATSTRPSECRSCSRRFALLRERVPEARSLLPRRGRSRRGSSRSCRDALSTTTTWPRSGSGRCWPPVTCCVSLRWPTMGETSAIVVRALTLGRPLVVSDVGWFADLPDEVAVKVPVGGDEVEVLADTLESLARDPVRREAMGAAARALAEGEHDLERAAEAYTAALEEAAGGEAVRDAVRREVAAAAAETGLPPDGDGAGRDCGAPARGRPWSLSAPLNRAAGLAGAYSCRRREPRPRRGACGRAR